MSSSSSPPWIRSLSTLPVKMRGIYLVAHRAEWVGGKGGNTPAWFPAFEHLTNYVFYEIWVILLAKRLPLGSLHPPPRRTRYGVGENYTQKNFKPATPILIMVLLMGLFSFWNGANFWKIGVCLTIFSFYLWKPTMFRVQRACLQSRLLVHQCMQD